MDKNSVPHPLCESCAHFNAQSYIHEIDQGQGRCHRYPPAFTESSSGDKSHHWQYPLVHADNWCGEHLSVNKTIKKTLHHPQ